MDTHLITPARFDRGMGSLSGQPMGEPEMIGAGEENDVLQSAYCVEYTERAEAGEPNLVDRGNALVDSALIALGRIAGDTEATESRLIADAEDAFAKVRASASLAARFHGQGREAAAKRCVMHAAERLAELRNLNPDKFEVGDNSMVAEFADNRAKVRGRRS